MAKVYVVSSGDSTHANSYLVCGPERTVLIDAGGWYPKWHMKQIKKIMDENSIKRIDAILLTHGHNDHAQGLSAMADRFMCPAFCHKADLPMVEALNGKGYCQAFTDGVKTIDLGGGDRLDILPTPGHTPGSVCYYNPESKSLFTGDTVINHKKFGKPTVLTDIPQYTESLRGLCHFCVDNDVQHTYSGHWYPPTEDKDGVSFKEKIKHMPFEFKDQERKHMEDVRRNAPKYDDKWAPGRGTWTGSDDQGNPTGWDDHDCFKIPDDNTGLKFRTWNSKPDDDYDDDSSYGPDIDF